MGYMQGPRFVEIDASTGQSPAEGAKHCIDGHATLDWMIGDVHQWSRFMIEHRLFRVVLGCERHWNHTAGAQRDIN